MMAFPSQPSNQKWCNCLVKTRTNHHQPRPISVLYIALILGATLAGQRVEAEQPPGGEEHEFEELGVNRYTAPSIAQIFKQLDDLRPLPFDQLKRESPLVAGGPHEQKGLALGALSAEGVLVVEA